MRIQSKLNKKQYEELLNLYIAFFQEIDFNNAYSIDKIRVFAHKKIKDAKHPQFNHIYFYLIDDHDNLMGFIHGKIVEDIGLICHTYVLPSMRLSTSSSLLIKHLCNWFKTNNIYTLETEVSPLNNIKEKMESNGWQKKQEFSDAIIYKKQL